VIDVDSCELAAAEARVVEHRDDCLMPLAVTTLV
jgi:hypothetical protein